MNASMVRMGGIAAFVMIALSIIGGLLLRGSGVGGLILNLINLVLLLFVFWTTKGYFNAQGYNRADLPILLFMGAYTLSVLIGLVTGSAGGFGAISASGGAQAFGIIGIIVLLLMLVAMIGMLIFALRCLDFGKTGGGLWKAIGILYLIGLILLILLIVLILIAALTKSIGLMAAGGILGLIGILVLLAAWVCHGIGLIMGAGKMGA